MNNCFVRLCGGLGNQLFQIANGYAYSKCNSKELVINAFGWNASQGSNPLTYKDSLYVNFNIDDNAPPHKQALQVLEKQDLVYVEHPKVDGDIIFNGYFQSPKYFQEYLKEFEKELIFPEVKTDHISPDSVAFHIRKGDYKNWVHIFGDNTDYFRRMFEKFKGEDVHVFTDAPHTILQLFAEYDFKLIQTSSELNDLTMLTKYDRIVCSNSSFSWWGAVLGGPKKEVIVPDKWLLNVEDCSDIYMPNMIKYEF